jgi:hypothetical protein
MNRILIIILTLISINACGQSYKAVTDQITIIKTKSEFEDIFTKLKLTKSGVDIERGLDFGIRQLIREFNYDYITDKGSYLERFRINLLLKDDTIYFGKLQRLNTHIKKDSEFDIQTKNDSISNYISRHNEFYETNWERNEFIDLLTTVYEFSFGCGDGGTYKPDEAKKTLGWVKSKKTDRLIKWLKTPNCELQAYGVVGLLSLKYQLKQEELDLIAHLTERNSMINHCAGCFSGLNTPLKELVRN